MGRCHSGSLGLVGLEDLGLVAETAAAAAAARRMRRNVAASRAQLGHLRVLFWWTGTFPID